MDTAQLFLGQKWFSVASSVMEFRWYVVSKYGKTPVKLGFSAIVILNAQQYLSDRFTLENKDHNGQHIDFFTNIAIL